MSLPISVILTQIESAPSLLLPILLALHYDKTILASLSKSNVRHLVSRALNLVRSHQDHAKWCGVSITRVICGDMGLVAAEGATIFTALLKSLETSNDLTSSTVLKATLDALFYLCKQIRGKPTLTRELLTPRLAQLISLLIEKLHHAPAQIIDFLRVLLWNHPTTFRPYANKLRQLLLSLLARSNWASSASSIKDAAYQALAALPVIEKTDAPSHWQSNVLNTVREIRSALGIYGEFLNLNDDPDVQRLMEVLPSFDDNACTAKPIFPSLAIDVNDPELILAISDRLETLFALLAAYCTFETAFPVRVPLGTVMTLAELTCTINLRFISFRNDIRDATVQEFVRTTLSRAHLSSVMLVDRLVHTFKGMTIPHALLILSSLEALLPMTRGRVEYTEMLRSEPLVREVLQCATITLNTCVRLIDASPVLRLVDVALAMVEPRVLESGHVPSPVARNGKQRKVKAKNGAVPLADLLSHQHLFAPKVPRATEAVVRRFLAAVLAAVGLPATQQHKIMRQALVDAVSAQHIRAAPADVRKLLVGYITLPSSKTGSLLPMVSTLFPTDPVITVFNNPRFPPMPMHVKVEQEEGLKEMDFEENDQGDMSIAPSRTELATSADEKPFESQGQTDTIDSSRVENDPTPKRQKVSVPPTTTFQNATFEESQVGEPNNEIPIEADGAGTLEIMTSTSTVSQDTINVKTATSSKVESVIVHNDTAEQESPNDSRPVPRAAPRPHTAEYSDESDFEMPQIDGAESDSDLE